MQAMANQYSKQNTYERKEMLLVYYPINLSSILFNSSIKIAEFLPLCSDAVSILTYGEHVLNSKENAVK